MSKFILSTDSCCDEMKSNLTKTNINYISLVYLDDKETYDDNFERNEDYQFFYNEQIQGKHFKTAGLNPYDVENYFTELLQQNMDIIHISLSSGLSGTFSIVDKVASDLNEKSSGPKIYIIDSKSATQGQKQVLYQARKCRDNNMSAEDTAKYLNEELIPRMNVGFFVGDIENLKRGGRISPLQAAIGKMLQIRPMLEFQDDGKLHIIDKPMGTKKAIKLLAERAIKNYDPSLNEPLYIAHTGNFDLVYELKSILEKEFGNPQIIVSYIGPVIGSHTGPNALGLVFINKK